MSLQTFQINVTANDPQGSSFMDATAGPTYLVTELQDIKSVVRGNSLNKTWISLLGLQGIWTGGLIWSVISGTQAAIQGDQTVATGTGYIIVGNRVKAMVTAGTIYGTITAAVAGGGITTVTFSWDGAGALDSGLSDIQQALDLSKVISVAPFNYAVITNTGSAWTGTINPAILSYVQGAEYRVRWTVASQGADTIALNGLAALPVKKVVAGAFVNLAAGDIPAGDITDIIYDSAGPTLIIVGGPSVPSNLVSIFDRSVGNPAVTVVNTTTETTLYTKSIPGNTIGIDGALRLTIIGDFLNNSGGGCTFTFRVKFGGTTVLDNAASISPAATANYNPFRLVVYITNLGVANLQLVNGLLNSISNGGAANGVLQLASVISATGEYNGLAIDTTTAQTLAVTALMGTANANCSVRMFAAYVEQIPA